MFSNKEYELFNKIDPDKFMDFIMDYFEKVGMKNQELPIKCEYCPLIKECEKAYESDEDITCLELVARHLGNNE